MWVSFIRSHYNILGVRSPLKCLNLNEKSKINSRKKEEEAYDVKVVPKEIALGE